MNPVVIACRAAYPNDMKVVIIMHNPRRGHARGTDIALPNFPSVRLALHLRRDWNKNARRPYLQVSYPLHSDKTWLGVAVVLEQYHRNFAARQYTLAPFCRATLSSTAEGIIK